jgi:hypothetical protein
MRKLLLVAGIAALALPGLAMAGPTGFYDADGVYHAGTPQADSAASASAYSAETSYAGGANIDERESALSREIQMGENAGVISRGDADHAYHDLHDIRRHEADLIGNHDGLTRDDRRDLSRRLDDLSDRVGDQLNRGD